MTTLENIPAGEAEDIAEIAELTIKQLEQRYASHPPALRGVHAKDHGCVTAKFKIREDLPEELRTGLFASPGREYEALIRFSNASVSEDADSPFDERTKLQVHGSRGMAIKVLGVGGTPLLPVEGRLTQDFVMINQPVFAFANVRDYLALSQVLLRDADKPDAFIGQLMGRKDEKDAHGQPTLAAQIALRTLTIIGRIRSTGATEKLPPPFQAPPASPLGNQYFSAAPFRFGEGRVAKFSAKPEAPVITETLDLADPRYLRTALRKRLTAPGATNVVFKFQAQIRTAEELAGKIDTDIEDATIEWVEISKDKATKFNPFTDLATITIPPQDFETAERHVLCDSLAFSPWHGLAEHRPLGGINRLRRPVYAASSHHRMRPKIAGGCPMSGLA